MSRPYAEVIGDPIAHSKSPLIHNFWLGKLGIDAEYRACHVRAEELAAYFARRRGDTEWRGCNVTIPHKVAAMSLADHVDGEAREIGATNCVFPSADGLCATNTDSRGVLEAVDTCPWPVCVIGNGGAARAALGALDLLAAHNLRLLVRDEARGRAMLDELRYDGEVIPFARAGDAMRDCEGVINATSLGMTGQPEMPASLLDGLANAASSAFVFDMVYAPLDTRFLSHARKLSLRTIDGLTMLIGQASQAFWHFFGQSAPRDHDAELRALLTA